MEDMDIEQVVDIPDTPERGNARQINGAQLGKERNSSVAGYSRASDFRNKECLNELKPRSRLVSENGYHRRLHLGSQRVPVKMDDFAPRNNSTAFSPLQKSYSSQNDSLFRREAMANKSKPRCRQSIGTQHLDKGKAGCSEISSKSLVCIDEDALFNMAFSCGASKTLHAGETKDVQESSNSGSSLRCSPVTSRNALKGKEKVDVNACNGFGSAINHGNGTDSISAPQHKIEKQKYASHPSVPSPRVLGQKRLVRNGCISPHNIASREKNLAETDQVVSSNVRKYHSSNMVSDVPSKVDIKEIVAEDNEETDCHRAKGKGVIIYPSTSKEHDGKLICVSTSSGTNNTASNETGDAWRSTRNCTKIIYRAEDDDEVFVDEQHKNIVTIRNNGNGHDMENSRNFGDQGEDHMISRFEAGQIRQLQPIRNAHTKRQKKHGLTSRNQNQFSETFPEDSEIVFLGSSGESSSSRSSRTSNRQSQGFLEPICEIDESLPERRTGNSQRSGSMNDEDADAKARQVEADEILARELQEQLYHEAPIFQGSEIDENLAWVLQQEEDVFPTASGRNNPPSRLRTSSTIRANRQSQPQFFQNPSNRRGSQMRVPATRTSQLRNRLFNRSPAGLSRARNHSYAALSTTRNLQFPLGMDLDMRLDILEALEDAVGEFNDMSMTASRILEVQRDFNENDYEMLLALDENNHQHGASVSRINSLPETVVQSENFEEACAICLETPSIGETIRHLPCLHKFHKECIDPWLSRKTSCPVCKSSIT